MAITTFKKCVITLCCVILSTTYVTSQEMMYKIPLKKQVELSTQIVEGEVISKQSYWDAKHETILTSYTVNVFKSFKGQAHNTIEVVTPGGIVDLEAQVVSHSLQLVKGDVGMFMLSNSSIPGRNLPTYKSTTDAQGFFKYSIEKDRVANTFTFIDGIANNFYDQIKQVTNTKFIEVETLELEDASVNRTTTSKSSASVISLSATNNSAGTKSVLTISGSGFGSTKGTIGFSNANYGGALHSEALDNQVLSWTNNKIEVEIPDIAGTGTVKINTTTNGSIESTEALPINFAQVNLDSNTGSGNNAYQTQHVSMNNAGGYTWIMNASFKNNQDAKNAFMRAFESWSCDTGVNWVVDTANTTSTNTAVKDGESVITFDPNLSGSVLGRCTSYYKGCFVGGEVQWYVEEMDIVFNASKNWNYSTGLPTATQADFESTAVHELGHGHQLGHVIDSNEIMHYSLSSGISRRDLSNKDLSGASDVQSRSTDTTVCSQDIMTNSQCFEQSLGAADFELANNITLYPNPAFNEVFIKSKAALHITNISLYSILGKLVYNDLKDTTTTKKRIDISNLSSGIYLIKIDANDGTATKKLIIR